MSTSWPFSARIQPFSETTTVIGSRSIIAVCMSSTSCSGASPKVVRRLPSGVLGPKVLRTSRIWSAIVAHCLSSDLTSAFSPFCSLVSVGVLAPDLHLLELAQGAQPHVEDRLGLHVGELEALHQDGLRLVLVADDADHLVEVEIGDQVAVEHLQPLARSRRAGAWRGGPAPRGGAPAIRAAPRRGPSPCGTTPLDSTFMLSGMRLSRSVRRNSDSIISAGVDRAALRLDDDADVLGRTRRGCRRPAAASWPPAARRSSRSAAPSAPDRESR